MQKRRKKKRTNLIILLFFGIFPIISLTTILCIYIWYAPTEVYREAYLTDEKEPVIVVLGNPKTQDNGSESGKGCSAGNIVADSEPQTVSESVHESREYFGVSASKQAALEKEVDELMALTD